MKKLFLFFIVLFCFLSNPALSKTIKAGITYTVDSARAEAFDGVERKIDMAPYEKYFFDPNFEKHQKDIKRGKLKYWDRYITLFSNGNYGVSFYYPEISFFMIPKEIYIKLQLMK